MADWLNDFHEAQRSNNDIVYELQSLASAFYRVGNTIISDQLFAMARSLEENNKIIGDSVSISINERLKDAQQSSANIFHAALAGIKLNVKDDAG